MTTGRVTFSDHCRIYSPVLALQVLLPGCSQVTCNSFAKDFKAEQGGNGLNHHIKLNRRLITEAVVKINCSLY